MQRIKPVEKEQYMTPRWAAGLCVNYVLPHTPARTFVDPFAGTGVFADALAAGGCSTVITNDIDPKFDCTYTADAFHLEFRGVPVMTNPPFSFAARYIEFTLNVLRVPELHLLLPLSFLGSARRRALFERHPPHLALISPRISYEYEQPDGTWAPSINGRPSRANGDSALYSWCSYLEPHRFDFLRRSEIGTQT